MTLKNRIAMAPIGNSYAADQGYVSQRVIDFHEARAKGGTALIIVGSVAPSLQSRGRVSQINIGDDSYIPGFRDFAEQIHKYGAKLALQLQHPGREVRAGQSVGVVPSVIPGASRETPHELTIDEIEEIIEGFAGGARRAREAGIDGVELHAAHAYLISLFLSSTTNRRQDRYGGTLENRTRFLVEIFQAIRKEAGPDYPVWPRVHAQEFGMENGITLDEARQIVQIAVDAGAQAIHVSAYGIGSHIMTAPIPDSPGSLVPLAEEIKKTTGVPVIAVGRISPEIAEQTLEEGKADLIAIGRHLLADPEWSNKVAEGRLDEINPCIGCMECFERPAFGGQEGGCAVNATMGKEGEYQIQPAQKVKKVMVVGSGPAGMEAARVAALRGHQVTLFEKEPRLGGQLNVAAIPPHKADILPFIGYLTRQVEKAGVVISLGTEVTQELVMGSKPDAVVVAIGGNPSIPDIPGTDKTNVVTAVDVLSGRVEVGQNVVIIGGGMVGGETADFLAEKGKKVTIVEVLQRIASDMLPMVRRRLLDSLRRKEVTMLTGITCQEITASDVIVTASEGQTQTIKADTVVLATGYKANDDLFNLIKDKVLEAHCIGDSSEPRRIMEAIGDGYRTGLTL